ncbi:site-specific integrase [Aurantimonas sp. C2-6-R+9]|uniref:tyrosine-type recombinase/integrase n=1 Tax=unclassified Aurantimonas TaxID=2638230 RepID=UPI002E183593|nr:site-specific integrase [Aurantimonas sp. C2-6-R+9]
MATTKLTKRAVDGLAAKDKAFIVYDADLKGFAVRISATGVKTWQVEYRPFPGGRSVTKRRMALGSVQSLTPDEARRKARDILTAASKGNDPARDRADKRKELRIVDLIDLYEEEGCYVQRGMRQGEAMKPTTKAYTLGRLRNHVVPLLGTRRITEISSTDIERMVRDIGKGKTASDEKIGPRQRIIVRGGEGAARKVARDLSAVFSFAVRRRLVTENPFATASIRKTDNRRTRYLSIEEVGRLGQALEILEGQGINPKALDICRLWALTGCRRDEIAGLKWAEVDFQRSCLALADSKTGASVRPLAAPALAMLSALPRYGNSPFVFPASSGAGHFQGTKRIWPKVVELAKLPGVTPQTLRHTLGSAAVSTGETLAMTGAILGHSNARSTSIYAHVQFDPATQAAGRAVGPIAAALSGKRSAEVIGLKKDA